MGETGKSPFAVISCGENSNLIETNKAVSPTAIGRRVHRLSHKDKSYR